MLIFGIIAAAAVAIYLLSKDDAAEKKPDSGLPKQAPPNLTNEQCIAILSALSPTLRAQIDSALKSGTPAQVKASLAVLAGGLDTAGFHNEAECVRRITG